MLQAAATPASAIVASLSPAGVQVEVTRILFSVRVPVLSVQTTEVEPRVSTADSDLTSTPRRAISRTPDREGQRDRGQQPFRDVGHEQPDREADGSADAQPGSQADRQERDACLAGASAARRAGSAR